MAGVKCGPGVKPLGLIGNQPLHWYIADETSLIPYESGQLDYTGWLGILI